MSMSNWGTAYKVFYKGFLFELYNDFFTNNYNFIKMRSTQKHSCYLDLKTSYLYSYVCLCICTNT